MIASDVLRRIVATPTTTQIRGPSATAVTFDDNGVLGNLFVVGNVFADDFEGLIFEAIFGSGFDAQQFSKVTGGLQSDNIIVTDFLEIPALNLGDGTAAPVSNVGQASLRYLPATDMIQYSKNAGPWTDLV